MAIKRPVEEADVDRLYRLLDQARTFFIQYEEYERVSESIAVSHLLTVADHPNIEAIHGASHGIDQTYCRLDRFNLLSGWPAHQLLMHLLELTFDPLPNSDEEHWLPQSGSLGMLDGRLRLQRHIGSLVINGYVPTFDECWDWLCESPRRDLSPYRHEIMSVEELRAKWRTDGARRSSSRIKAESMDKVERLTGLLGKATEVYIPQGENAEMLSLLVEVAMESDTSVIGYAGSRLLASCDSPADLKRAKIALSVLSHLLFDRRTRGCEEHFPLAPIKVVAGRLRLSREFEPELSDEEWEGETLVRARLYSRRDVSKFGHDAGVS